VYTDIIYQESKEFLFCLWLVEVNWGGFLWSRRRGEYFQVVEECLSVRGEGFPVADVLKKSEK
jgi:hypothetical protein